MDDVPAALGSLFRAINGHDPVAVAACFVPEYLNETPVHPSRGFSGRAQVRENWSHILAAVPDLAAVLVRWGTSAPRDPATLWAEWDWSGTRGDGTHMRMRGVTVLGIGSAGAADTGDDAIRWSRFYMEEVDAESVAVATAVERTVGSAP
ncbi:nuclear transport factor 2 family protein [Blastococcus sp. CT_GayMR16]|uniref:nuclear transport factor 2 family protein n=1 Tax=Blastococcus sp. CT_GayMR16 TaxID=2559607 RepID=UPI001073B7FD|nr:nuclear transport factor 2 family protein [Blastococcus sp. CT_GayMR16]TFV86572.1 nuclear transport factor 2 family protein [Blastococcus sp. CT_GayMR16]